MDRNRRSTSRMEQRLERRSRYRLYNALALEGQNAARLLARIRGVARRWERLALGLLRAAARQTWSDDEPALSSLDVVD